MKEILTSNTMWDHMPQGENAVKDITRSIGKTGIRSKLKEVLGLVSYWCCND